MQKFTLNIILLLALNSAYSQKVEIIRQSENLISKTDNYFAFLETTTDTLQLTFVATVKASGKKNDVSLQNLFYKIHNKANALGANSFKLNTYISNDSTTESVLILDTYVGSVAVLDTNFDHHEQNMIVIFGDDKINGSDTYSFKINDEKKNIKSGTYYKYIIAKDREIKINNGGFLGMTVFLKWKPNKQAAFLSLTGFGIGGPLSSQTIGLSFNTGRINSIEGDFGLLLMQILKQSPK